MTRQNDPEQRARESALRYLSFRPRSVAEIKTFLKKKSFEHVTISSTIEFLSQATFLDDLQFAQWWTESRVKGAKSGPLRIRQELQQKGISKEMITEVLTRDWKNIAKETIRKAAGKISEPNPKKRIQKLQLFLARAGFTWDQIQGAIDAVTHSE